MEEKINQIIERIDTLDKRVTSDIIELRDTIKKLTIDELTDEIFEKLTPILNYLENLAMTNSIGLESILNLLISKNVLTEDEVKKESQEVADKLKERYEKFLSQDNNREK